MKTKYRTFKSFKDSFKELKPSYSMNVFLSDSYSVDGYIHVIYDIQTDVYSIALHTIAEKEGNGYVIEGANSIFLKEHNGDDRYIRGRVAQKLFDYVMNTDEFQDIFLEKIDNVV